MLPIALWSHAIGPNPWKVATIMEELEIPYNTKIINFAAAKEEPFLSINPNGRLPAIEDPNTGITLWESGAIVEYLIAQYDKLHILSYGDLKQSFLCRQWLFFQVSGQAPYFGQAAWFSRAHPEKLDSAIQRFCKEVVRVTGVLEKALKDNGGQWLVGDKCTYADLSFVPWQQKARIFGGEDLYEKFPLVGAWMERMEGRDSVKKVVKDQEEAVKAAGGRV
ncbi:hypothetical protein ASPVEDRAFT_24961 [Aspergillus versicolor CBS 583.65]|uniref:glutathione transferase n=1 Tax=Aspergillus versicolor CBS 583.65 TaxID=1036611 RepID=A0A1L9P9D6_ASPVE|nr:uncharacterized protein ASPVEDRAFT_24961 [Aspergillus versicolor CBS 583.65]OJI98054.1 hypothetical protein ASPVEDRAFT_24961 [Aspergillus versicolor CBS 583.65]